LSALENARHSMRIRPTAYLDLTTTEYPPLVALVRAISTNNLLEFPSFVIVHTVAAFLLSFLSTCVCASVGRFRAIITSFVLPIQLIVARIPQHIMGIR